MKTNKRSTRDSRRLFPKGPISIVSFGANFVIAWRSSYLSAYGSILGIADSHKSVAGEWSTLKFGVIAGLSDALVPFEFGLAVALAALYIRIALENYAETLHGEMARAETDLLARLRC